ncbi:MAG: adenylate/guanylate cyclase domain-containing protein [Sphingomicrobium sp.]
MITSCQNMVNRHRGDEGAMAERSARTGRRASLPGVIAVLVVALLALFPPPLLAPALERMSFLMFDNFQRIEPRGYQDAGVRIVDIDEESIRRLGQWPWPRTDIARLTDALASAGAAAIAYDVVLSEPDRTSPPRLAKRLVLDPDARATLSRLPDNDVVLAHSFARAPVVTGFFLTHDAYGRTVQPKAGFALSGNEPTDLADFTDAISPLPMLGRAASGNGFVSIGTDSDAIVRRAPLIARNGNAIVPSLSLDALRVAQGAGSVTIKTGDGSGEIGGGGEMVSLKVGQFEVPTTRSGDLWMRYTAPVRSRIIPAWKILSGGLSADELRREAEGRIIFVGAGAIGLRDLVSTPLQDRELGVMVHAQAAEQMILGDFLVRPDWAPGLEIALLLILGIGIAVLLPKIGALKGALAGASAILLTGAGSWYAYTAHHFLLDPTWPAVAVAAAYLVQTILTFYREERQRAYIHHAFDRYLSPELVKRIADDPALLELGGVERDMSVLFADIRSFSRISEKLAPSEVISFLVRFLTPMTDLLLGHKATIDKYIGDAILAFWNAPLDDPDHHRNAARAALDMQRRLVNLNDEMMARGDGTWPGEVKIGIGLNSGPCCVGNIGSERRLSYSLIGDPVNLASRLESLSKYYGVPILMGDALARHLGEFAILPIDRVRVVGRDHAETVHVLLGDEALRASPQFKTFEQAHQAMLAAYFAQDWPKAGALNDLREQQAAGFGLTKLVMLYRDRIAAFAADPPPAGWDGVFEASSK